MRPVHLLVLAALVALVLLASSRDGFHLGGLDAESGGLDAKQRAGPRGQAAAAAAAAAAAHPRMHIKAEESLSGRRRRAARHYTML